MRHSRALTRAALLACLGAIILASAALGLRNAGRRGELEDARAHAMQIRMTAARLEIALADAVAAARPPLPPSAAASRADLQTATSRARGELAGLSALTARDPDELPRVRALGEAVDIGLAGLEGPSEAGLAAAAQIHHARQALQAVREAELRALEHRADLAAAAEARDRAILLTLAVLAALSFGIAVAAVIAATRARVRREGDQRQAFVLTLADSARANPARALAETATRLGRRFGVSRCGFAEIDETGAFIDVTFEYTDGREKPALGRHRVEDFGPALAALLRAGHVVAVSDVVRDSRTATHAAAHQALGTRSFLVVPLQREGRLRAILHLSHNAVRAWTADDIALLRDAADRTWSIVEQSRAEAELARTSEEFRTLADNIPAMCWMAEPDGSIYWYNRRWYDYTGTTLREMQGWGWRKVHDPAVLPAVMQGWTDAIARGVPFEMTFPLRAADGSFRPFLTRVYPQRDAAGQVRRWFGVNTDISESKAREAALRRSEAELQARTQEIESLITSAPLGVCFLDRECRYLRINQTLADINGLPIEAHIGRTVADILPENAKSVAPIVERIFATGEAVGEIEIQGETPREPGVPRTWITGFYPVRGSDGGITAVGVWVIEITRRRRMEAALAESERRLQAIFETVEVGLVLAEAPSGRLVFGNAAMARIFRRPMQYTQTRDEYAAEWESYDSEGRRTASHEYPLARALATGEKAYGEYHFVCGDGVRRWISITGSPVYDGDGTMTGAVVVCADIDALKQAQAILARDAAELGRLVADRTRELADAQSRLAHAQRMEALGQLAGGIAHDFNNVLQAVLGGARLIERRPADADRNLRLAGMIAEAADRGAGVTRRLLAFSRRADLRAEPIQPGLLLASLAEVLTHTLGGAVSVDVRVRPGTPPLLADKGQLETALINLATNARDAMADGGTIGLTAEAATVGESGPHGLAPGPYVVLAVTDTGQGMPPDVLARASEPFFTTKPQGKGTGLGLATARGFAEQSGGALEIESHAGRGTIVRLWLPEAGAVEETAPPPPPPLPPSSARGRIILVDDEPLVRAITAEQLEAYGFEVETFANGRDAIAAIAPGRADLLITDLSMPGMDGLAVIREAQHRLPQLPAILLTGFATDAAELAVGGATSGRFSLLRKPITGRLLAERVAVLLDAATTRA